MSCSRSTTNKNCDVQSVHLFIDNHPYDESSIATDILEVNSLDNVTEIVFDLPLSDLQAGKHLIYVQAKGTEVFGPASSTFYELPLQH